MFLENPSAVINTRSSRRRSDSNIIGSRSNYWERQNQPQKTPVKKEKFKLRSGVERPPEEE